ncbi:hypothetical protein H2203_007180 [Taxawa tesnikishii (nom. ined.)]|nr:hypothetical protein H2203_007180 [Dothideales sp. JES 119]
MANSTTAPDNLVLLTGATGFIGFRVLQLLLEQNYHVRVAVRSESKIFAIKNNPSFASLNKTPLLLHARARLPRPWRLRQGHARRQIRRPRGQPHANKRLRPPEKHVEYFVTPAVGATLTVLESAKKVGSVEKVVITSSILANVPPAVLFGLEKSEEKFGADSPRIPDLKPPFSSPMQAYAASKYAALNATEAWVRENEPKFSVVGVFPGYVFGRDAWARETKDLLGTTNGLLLRPITGGADESKPDLPQWASLDDVAEVHVRALDSKISGHEGFTVAVQGRWEGVPTIVMEGFKREIEEGLIPENMRSMGTLEIGINNEKTEKMLGRRLRGAEEVVREVVGQYVELVRAGKGE